MIKAGRRTMSAADLYTSKPHRVHLCNEFENTTEELQSVVQPHIGSFDFMLGEGLTLAVAALHPVFVEIESNKICVKLWVEDVQIGKPRHANSMDPLYPHECRERRLSYGAPMIATVVREILPESSPIDAMSKGDSPGEPGSRIKISVNIGLLPLMVKSRKCHLHDLSRAELVKHKEEANETGGYFIINGNERVCRLLIMLRRNHVIAVMRPSFTNRGTDYTAYATEIRCVCKDQTAKTVRLHYLQNGTCRLRFSYRKKEFFLPLVLLLRAFTECSDLEVFAHLTGGNPNDTFAADRAEIMIREVNKIGVLSHQDAIRYIGNRFRFLMYLPECASNEDACKLLLKDNVFIHIASGSERTDGHDKFNLLVLMTRKLFALVSGRCKPDNTDAPSSQELLLPGFLINMILKEQLQGWLGAARSLVMRDIRYWRKAGSVTDENYWRGVLQRVANVGMKVSHFITTGNLSSRSGLDLMQISGFTIVADKLNFIRFMSHFRAVHRGQFFMTMKTTAVRKLLPESWGFLCPVHTPDGSPCGLLNHLTASCIVQTERCTKSPRALINLMAGMGMDVIVDGILISQRSTDHLVVVLDGIVVGNVALSAVDRFVRQLRYFKVVGHPAVPKILEIAYLPKRGDLVYPGVFLFTTPARFLRPVRHLGITAMNRSRRQEQKRADGEENDVELVGSLEQMFMGIACTPDDYRAGETTHMELTPVNMLSVIASFTPFSDHNQSPRNMYQCQMGKQTMGTPFHSFPHRTDNKAYRIQTPQVPIVRNNTHTRYMLDEYPLGTNAVVAVISYTGYDMEDAMIVNKSSYERGFAHASVYKAFLVDPNAKTSKSSGSRSYFGNKKNDPNRSIADECTELADPSLDVCGLPAVGVRLKSGDAMYACVDADTGRTSVSKFKDLEPCSVEDVRIVNSRDSEEVTMAMMKIRFSRNPVIGDKFSSRHGQKGVMSRLWPHEDMPFSESGITPDIIINPHAFPSRMTIGMLIESMAGKSGCLHGTFQDGTPFRFGDKNRAVDYFGAQLVKAGYNYAGNEVMYSGITGEEFRVDIFLGVVYYQRLRHMVSDKSQVRATGPINQLTRQPIKGRKKHGGIRFGEMERDSLLAHGTAYLLQDRLMHCSDYHTTVACTECGSILAPVMCSPVESKQRDQWMCRNCRSTKHCVTIAMPFVFAYLANELAAMNIRLSLDIKA